MRRAEVSSGLAVRSTPMTATPVPCPPMTVAERFTVCRPYPSVRALARLPEVISASLVLAVSPLRVFWSASEMDMAFGSGFWR